MTRSLRPASVLFFLGGVVLPAVALAFELLTSGCAHLLFDPLPTVFHPPLVAAVPAVLFVAWVDRYLGSSWSSLAGLLPALVGAAAAIAGAYAIPFLPVVPISVVGILYYGIGLLPLAPLVAAATAGWALFGKRPAHGTRLSWGHRTARAAAWGFGGGLAVVLLAQSSAIFTGWALQEATSVDPARRARGLTMLRLLASEEALLRACYWRPREVALVWPDRIRIEPEAAQEVYFRVTGRSFAAVRPPDHRRRWGWVWDRDQGGERVGARVEGLALAGSALDGSISGEGGVGYLEWTLVFRHRGRGAAEARAEVELPPGGVVSRLVLWVDGEPREAAFAARRPTREAYEAVVRRRRDPVLVTSAGPDRVLVQCFPVVPGGSMQLRLGISFPLHPRSGDELWFRLPAVVERNFSVPPDLGHQVWIEGDGLQGEVGGGLGGTSGAPTIRGEWSDAELNRAAAFPVKRSSGSMRASAPWRDGHVVARLERRPAGRRASLFVVLDGSRSMGGFRALLAERFGEAPPDGVWLAGDEVEAWRPGDGDIASWVRRRRFQGGQDPFPALRAAWDAALSAGGGTVLWITGALPVALSEPTGLAQRTSRRPEGPTIVVLPFEGGANRALQRLEEAGVELDLRPRSGSPPADLAETLQALHGDGWQWRRSWLAGPPPAGSVETSRHLVRLWAHQEVGRRARSGGGEEAVALATELRLVTPWTGAVVLERDEQYAEAGIEAPGPVRVPTIPEPELVALLVLAAAALAWAAWRGGPV